MTISKGSWHYRLYSTYWKGHASDSVNLCPYLRGVIMGFFMTCIVVAVGTMVVVAVLEPIAIGTLWLVTGKFYPSFIGPDYVVVLIVEGGILIGVTVYYSSKGISKLWTLSAKKIEDAPATNFTTLLSAGYKSVHDRVCPTIRITDGRRDDGHL